MDFLHNRLWDIIVTVKLNLFFFLLLFWRFLNSAAYFFLFQISGIQYVNLTKYIIDQIYKSQNWKTAV